MNRDLFVQTSHFGALVAIEFLKFVNQQSLLKEHEEPLAVGEHCLHENLNLSELAHLRDDVEVANHALFTEVEDVNVGFLFEQLVDSFLLLAGSAVEPLAEVDLGQHVLAVVAKAEVVFFVFSCCIDDVFDIRVV